MAKEFKLYFKKRFYKDKNGYYVNSMPIHAHRWVWINHYGTIPDGMDIHHIDGNKENNEIENLEIISRSEHLKKHWREGAFDLEQRRKQLSEARQWLKTPQGKKKQREKAKEGWRKRKLILKKCNNCNENFETFQRWAKCCNQNCYMKYRRKSGIDNIERNCWICNEKFTINKHAKTRTCTKKCADKLMIITRSQND